jgi:hypothetical protein
MRWRVVVGCRCFGFWGAFAVDLLHWPLMANEERDLVAFACTA